jgi:uncharacterized damage-inducible protein DinB
VIGMPSMPGPVADERDGLLSFLDQQRQLVRLAAYGLTDEQARATPSASSLSVGGLVKHLSAAERTWVTTMRQQPRNADPAQYMASFVMTPDETLADLLDDYTAAAQETSDAVESFADLGAPVPVPKGVPWLPQDIDAWSVRWVLLHLIEETARHAGHADIVRETVDGATSARLMAAAEGWPESGWITPWRPGEL